MTEGSFPEEDSEATFQVGKEEGALGRISNVGRTTEAPCDYGCHPSSSAPAQGTAVGGTPVVHRPCEGHNSEASVPPLNPHAESLGCAKDIINPLEELNLDSGLRH